MSKKLIKNKKEKLSIPRIYIIQIISLITILIFGAITIKNEYKMILSMFLSIFLIGLSCFPFIYLISKTFKEKGYFISKSIGILINGFIIFTIASFDLLKYESLLIYGTLILVAAINWIFIFPKIRKEITKKDILLWITEEIIFLGLLTLFSYIRGFKNEISQTEKYMDYGIIMSCFKAKYFPIEDMWMNGRSLNYYYYGQYILSYLIKFSKGTVESGYNICLSVIIALSSINLGSIIYNILNKLEINKFKIRIFSILTPLFTFFAASCHYLIYGIILFIKDKSYIVYDSTRYIGYNPDTSDKTIHEFPAYGFLLGDAHAYTINTIFVIALLFILFTYIYQEKKKLKDFFINPYVILLGFIIGNFQMINYWDFPIYMIVCGSVILFSNIRNIKINSKTFWTKIVITLFQGIEILGLSMLTSLKFMTSFMMISSEIKLCKNHSLPHQLFVLWGFFLIITISFIIYFMKNKKVIEEKWKNIDITMILISLCGLGLVLLPEIIYVEDIYENGYSRANTMFKLTYQAFILLSMSSTYFIYRLLNSKLKIVAYIGLLILIINSTYPIRYIAKDYGNIFSYKYYDGLDGTRYLTSFANGEYYSINYINENIEGRHTILEATGPSYSTFNKISSFTGNSTIYGWDTHESLWNNYEEQDERTLAISTIYTSSDLELVKKTLKKYNVEYIFIGPKEFEAYENNIQLNQLFSLGEIVFTKNDCRLIKLNQDILYQ